MTSSKPASPPHSSSKERKEDEGEGGGGGGGEADRTSSEGLKKDERTKEQMEVGEEKVGEKEDEVSSDNLKSKDFRLYCTSRSRPIVIVTVNISINDNAGYVFPSFFLFYLNMFIMTSNIITSNLVIITLNLVR